jgi:hypothetical protein
MPGGTGILSSQCEGLLLIVCCSCSLEVRQPKPDAAKGSVRCCPLIAFEAPQQPAVSSSHALARLPTSVMITRVTRWAIGQIVGP